MKNERQNLITLEIYEQPFHMERNPHSYWSAPAHFSALPLEYRADAFDEHNGHQSSIVDECNEISIWIYDQSDAKWVDFFTYLKLA